MTEALKANQVFKVPYPFVWQVEGDIDAFKLESWRPGVRFEPIGPEDSAAFADAMGFQILTVVSIHKPGKYPERVFYTRRWIDPDSEEFGNDALRVKSKVAFMKLTKGYRYDFTLESKAA